MSIPDPWQRRLSRPALPQEALGRLPSLQRAVLSWHALHGRHHLPWVSTDPYAVWLSETMLQQTQVVTVVPRFQRWMDRFPTIAALASATEQEVLKEWEGLGYYARARRLHATAQILVLSQGGAMPRDRGLRLALPGIGPSTASAIGAFAWGLKEPIMDGNVLRVWSRWWATRLPVLPPAQMSRWWWGWVHESTPDGPAQVRAWTQAIMDLGATVCTPRAPRCLACPLRRSCAAYASKTPEAWPVRTPRTAKKIWEVSWSWCVNAQTQVWVTQRPSSGIWGGLWEVPVSLPAPPGVLMGSGKQVLSHRQVHWQLVRAVVLSPDPGLGKWVDQATWESLPKVGPLRQWWEGLNAEQKVAAFEVEPLPT